MLDCNIDRWVFASISKHFDDRKGNNKLHIEGMQRDTRTTQAFLELRVDGPQYTEVNKGLWKVYVEINILCQCNKDLKNFHKMRQLSGEAVAMFENCIIIYKYGDSTVDDQSVIGAMKRLDNEASRNNLQVSHFGQVDPVNQLEQATIEAHYSMFLEE